MQEEQKINPELGRYLSLLSLTPRNRSPTKKYCDTSFFLLFKSPALPLSLPDCNQQQDSGTGKDSAKTCEGD